MAESKLWEQLPEESAAHYDLFLIYRDMGANRSLRKMAAMGQKRDYNGPKILKFTQLSMLSSKYNWVKRCQAWDSEQFDEYNEYMLGLRKQNISKIGDATSKMLDVLDKALEDIELKPIPEQVGIIAAVSKAMKDVQFIQNLNDGAATEHRKLSGTVEVEERPSEKMNSIKAKLEKRARELELSK